MTPADRYVIEQARRGIDAGSVCRCGCQRKAHLDGKGECDGCGGNCEAFSEYKPEGADHARD